MSASGLSVSKCIQKTIPLTRCRLFSSFFGLNMGKNKYTGSKEQSLSNTNNASSKIKSLDFSGLEGQPLRKTQLNIPYLTEFLIKHPLFDEQKQGQPLRKTQLNIPYLTEFLIKHPLFDEQKRESMKINKTLHLNESLVEFPQDTGLSFYIPESSTTETLSPNKSEVEYLSTTMGLSLLEIKSFKQRTLVVRRVVNQTRKGKIPSMYALVIVGNENGMIGMGEGKGRQLRLAAKKAYSKAIRNMQYIPRYEDRTIYGDVTYKFHAVRLELRSRPCGFGLRANHYVHEICRYVGIKDISAKVRGSRTGMNVVKATFEALKAQVLPEDIARARGRKVVDVIQTYYS
ncbi:hypothetical protein PORY_001260 [Pneumocystis oryctolagi]|uniref:Uncharacterized protein n=1 Tax=Pneumocystis oryctolagi TaxID=42067 RepID=A0ACB7CC78_9ASCO|nr:hypothetical protein PORY_001260 [Pneumocystis oryctolagi]